MEFDQYIQTLRRKAGKNLWTWKDMPVFKRRKSQVSYESIC